MSDKDQGRPGGSNFPCASLDEALPHLRRPPTPAAVRFKIQTTLRDAAQIAAYIDARLVFDRLDQVCGKEWAAVFEPLPDRLIPPPVDQDGEVIARPPLYVRCLLTVFSVCRQDVGEGGDPKAAFSDGVKRAAVHFGIGRALYAMRGPWLREGEGDGELRRNRRGYLVLDQRTEGWCRRQYAAWLERKGARLFGEPLDHGDDPGAPGLEAEAESGDGQASEAQVDQGHAGNAALEAQRRTAKQPASGAGDESAPPDRPMPSRRPQVASDGGGGATPTTAIDRRKISHWQQAGRYKDEILGARGARLWRAGDRPALARAAPPRRLAARARCLGARLAANARGCDHPGEPPLRPAERCRGARGLAARKGRRGRAARPPGGGVIGDSGRRSSKAASSRRSGPGLPSLPSPADTRATGRRGRDGP